MSAIIVVLALTATGLGTTFYIAATKWRSKAAVEAEIAPGTSVRKISDTLAASGVIRTPRLFELYARAKGVAGKLRAGTYEFEAGTTMLAALSKIERGDVKQYPFTIVEGWTIKDIAATLAGRLFTASPAFSEDFLRLTNDKDFISSLGISGAVSLEGYLFPDTYFLTRPVTPENFIRRLVARQNEVIGGLDGEAVRESGMGLNKLVTLASIIEKETGATDERPLIASVFFNRLKLGMPLQSDPTIIYGLPSFDGNIKKSDISNPHAYNTYVHPGLPPGPICNPGKASLEAVIHPAESKYLYFVSRNDGTHVFSETLAEHSKAVMKYQINRNSLRP